MYALSTSHDFEQSDFDVIDFKPKNFKDTDVEIAITHCG